VSRCSIAEFVAESNRIEGIAEILSDGSRYLPDFHLPLFDAGPWVEVKPLGGNFSKAIQFASDGGGSIWLAEGTPAPRAWDLACPGPPGEAHVEVVIPLVDKGLSQNRFYYCPAEFIDFRDLRAGINSWGLDALRGSLFLNAVNAARRARFEEA
jgi:hypothetical protein